MLDAKIKFYKLTGVGWHSPAYYAAYNESIAKQYAYSDSNSQFVLKAEEVNHLEIPKDVFIHNAGLEYKDARALVIEREETEPLT